MILDKNLQTLLGLLTYIFFVSYYWTGFINIQFVSFVTIFAGYILLQINNKHNFSSNIETTKNLFANICILFYFAFSFNIVKTILNKVFYFGFVETITFTGIVVSILNEFDFNVIFGINSIYKFISSNFVATKHLVLVYCKNIFNRLSDLYNVFDTNNRKEKLSKIKNNLTISAINKIIPISESINFDQIICTQSTNTNNIDTQINQSYKNILSNNNIMDLMNNNSVDSLLSSTNVVDDLDSSDDETNTQQAEQKSPLQVEKTNLDIQKARQQMLKNKINQKKNARTGNSVKNIKQDITDSGVSNVDMQNFMNNPNMASMMQNMMQDPYMVNMIKNMTGGSGKIDKKKMEQLLGKI